MSFDTPRATLDAYAAGCKALDRDLLARCFHRAAVMSGDLGGTMLIGGPAPFLDDVAALAAAGIDHSDFAANVIELTVNGRVAAGTVHSTAFAGRFDFLDRFHLVEDTGGWLITSKCFTTLGTR